MTTATLMLARDEADIIEPVIRHACWHTDEVIVATHQSKDDTPKILRRLKKEGLPLVIGEIPERAFYGEAHWSSMALQAFRRGHQWGIVWDADEIWHVTGQIVRISDWLAEWGEDVWVIYADEFNHIPTFIDDWDEPNPVLRTKWRQTKPDTMKTAFRLRLDVSYDKHCAWYAGERGQPSRPGLSVRHFTIRTPEQLIRKVRNGLDAFSVEAGQHEGADVHWGPWKGLDDAAIIRKFYSEFWSQNPEADPFLICDPAPVKP